MIRGRITAGILSSLAGLVLGAGGLAARPALTGTGGGPETTITAPYTTSTGQTVPPGRARRPEADTDARTERQRDLDRVLDGICTGCR